MHNNHTYKPSVSATLHPTFMGKVMSFFALGLLSTAFGAYIGMEHMLEIFIQYPMLKWLIFGAELALIFTSRSWGTKVPLNRALYALFTFISGLAIAPLMSVLLLDPALTAILYKALFATVLTFTATGLFGWTTNLNLSGMRFFLFAGLIGLIIVQVIGFFMPWGSMTEMVVSGFGVLLFAGYTAYEFQMLKSYPENRYVDAAIMLYLNIFNLFMFILRFMLAFSGRD